MKNAYRFKISREIHHSSSASRHGVLLAVEVTTSGKTFDVELRPSDLRNTRGIDAISDKTGLVFPDAQRARLELQEAASGKRRVIIRTPISGWHLTPAGYAFIAPPEILGDRKAARQLQFDAHASAPGGPASDGGTSDDWRKHVGPHMRKSTAAITLVGAALAAPLLRFADLRETFTLVLAGRQGTGKSTIQDGATSIQAPPTELSPDSTQRAFQERGAAHNDMLFPIGDLALLEPRARVQRLRHLAYGLTAAGGRATSRVNAGTLPDLVFQTICVCTSEETTTTLAESTGIDRQGGEGARLFDLTPSLQVGFFDRLADGDNPAAIAEAISHGAKKYHSAMLRDWISWISAQDPDWLKMKIAKRRSQFVSKAQDACAAGSFERRPAKKFGLIYAGLALAIEAELLDWGRAECGTSVLAAFICSMANAPLRDSRAASAALLALLRKDGSIVDQDDVSMTDEWFGVRAKYEGRSVIGLRHSRLVEVLGPVTTRLALESLETRQLLSFANGQARWQPRLGGKKPRLLPLSPVALDG